MVTSEKGAIDIYDTTSISNIFLQHTQHMNFQPIEEELKGEV